MKTISRHNQKTDTHNQKTDTTTQLHWTLSMYVTPKTISCHNQKTNTMPHLFCILICKYVTPKPYSCQNQKTDTTAELGKKFLQPTRSKCIRSSVCRSVYQSVRAKRGIWSKRVFMRMNSNFSFNVCWRNTTIIH